MYGPDLRFYAHLEAGSANDLTLVEDLDRVPDNMAGRGGGDSSPSHGRTGFVRKRSNSISYPASRPPLARPPVRRAADTDTGTGGIGMRELRVVGRCRLTL